MDLLYAFFLRSFLSRAALVPVGDKYLLKKGGDFEIVGTAQKKAFESIVRGYLR